MNRLTSCFLTVLLFLHATLAQAPAASTSFSMSVSLDPQGNAVSISVPIQISATGTSGAQQATVTGNSTVSVNGTASAVNGTAPVLTVLTGPLKYTVATSSSATTTLPPAPGTTVVAGSYVAPYPGSTINGVQAGPGDNYVAAARRTAEMGIALLATLAAIGFGIMHVLPWA